MSSNLVDTVTQILSDKVLDRFGSSIGLDRTRVENAAQAGIPALLASLCSLVSKPGGAAALSKTLTQQPSNALTKITNAVGGAGQNAILNSSTAALTSLLGNSTTTAITSAMARYAGIDNAGSKSIMGLLGATVMAALGQQQRAGNLDASGLAKLVTSQTDRIISALPSGISKYLDDAGLFDSLPQSHENPPASTPYESAAPRYAVAPTPKPTASQWGWLLPALAAVGLGAFAWHMLSRPEVTQTATVTAPEPTKPVTGASSSTPVEPSANGASTGVAGVGPIPTPSAGSIQPAAFQVLDNLRFMKVGDVDFGQQMTNAINGLRGSLGTITDEASARAALAPLNTSTDEFNKISGLVSQLSPENRKSLASALATVRPTLDQLFDRALQVPGASALIKPTIDNIRTKLDTLTTA
jgi:Bacterial protein of unknown function (DUF937)